MVSTCAVFHPDESHNPHLDLGSIIGSLDMFAHDDTSRYRQIVGSIMYLMTQTRPDLAIAAGRIARGMANPTTKDMEAAERLMGHIWRTRTEGITYRKQHLTSSSGIKLNAFVDAEFAGDHLDRRSTTGSCHRLDTCAIFA